MKSRVNRARNRLVELLSIVSSSDYGADPDWQSGIDSLIMGQRFSRTGSD
jgi:RNA polymerase sigma-70 factor (ECF subfamily)